MSTQHLAGRHRWGTPGLQYCRTRSSVHDRLERGEFTRHATPTGRRRLRPTLAIGFGAAVAALVGGWFTAGQALAEQITHH